MSDSSNQARKQINKISLATALSNFVSGTLLMINPVFASPANIQHNSSGSLTVSWYAVPLGFFICIIAFIQIIVALMKRRIPKPLTKLNKLGYAAIALGALFIVLIFLKNFNSPPLFILDGIFMIVLAQRSKIQNLSSILISAILFALAVEMTLTIAEVL